MKLFRFLFGVREREQSPIELEIQELSECIKVSGRLTKQQIAYLSKKLHQMAKDNELGNNLTYSDVDKAMSSQSILFKGILASMLQMEMRIARFRARDILDTRKRRNLGIDSVHVLFSQGIPVCPSLKKYVKKFNGKVVSLNKLPIFPLRTCYNCRSCCAAGPLKKAIIKGFNSK